MVLTSSAPSPLIVPAKTSSSGPLSTGTDSPVIGDWSTAEWPDATRPSTGMRSPGRTSTTCPTGTGCPICTVAGSRKSSWASFAILSVE